ncbi:MAG: hypothetical protein F4X36_18735, partial [Gammaproteobacteria bacterium]|nr:hypothetical protein [Gammaproteobacteria bacterium]
MRRATKPIHRGRQPTEQPPATEPARFLRNLTSLPDADFASTYSPAIAAVGGRGGGRRGGGAAPPAPRRARPAPPQRRRAFILPRFTQAEDSWRIRECASYAVAIVVLVEHAHAVLSREPSLPLADRDPWARILADPAVQAGGSSARAALFHAIVPAQGRGWIAREPLVQTLIANYFTDTDPNELRDIVAPLVAEFPQDRLATRQSPHDHSRPPNEDVPIHSASSPAEIRPVLARILARARSTLARGRPPNDGSRPSRAPATKVTETALARSDVSSPPPPSPPPRPDAVGSPQPAPGAARGA